MHEILGEVHYMPDKWTHTVEVYKEYTQVFQFTLVSPSLSVSRKGSPFLLVGGRHASVMEESYHAVEQN